MFGIRTKIRKALSQRAKAAALPDALKQPFTLQELRKKGLSRTEIYLYCDYYFHHFLPKEIKEHRRYFSMNGRGFGEDAFHSMWFMLFEHFRPAQALEIGVFRGQTITLWQLLARHWGFKCEIGCVSPFSSAGDSVSGYQKGINYYDDVVQNHRSFDLSLPKICKAFSTSEEAIGFIRSTAWNVAYIDGNHDYEVARQDWENCSDSVARNGLIVLDDAALNTDFRPPAFSTAGHPGPSKVASEIEPTKFQEIIGVGHNRVFERKAP